MFSPAKGGQPSRSVAAAERHARDFEALLAKVESGAAADTGALAPDAPDELETLQTIAGRERTARAAGALVRRTRNAPRMTARRRGRNTRTPGIRRNPPSVLHTYR